MTHISKALRQSIPAFLGIVTLTILLSATSLSALLVQVETISPSPETGEQEQPPERPRTDERPRHIRSDERDYLEQLNDQQEQLGDEIQRGIEAQGDVVGEGKSFEEIKAEAEAKLNMASPSQQPSPESVGEVHGAAVPDDAAKPSRVCFAADGSVTSDAGSCDPDQSRHFGFARENGPEDEGFAIPSSEEVFDSVTEDFRPQTPTGGSVLSIISDALTRLSEMIPSMNGNPAVLTKIQETIRWLSGLLTQHDTGELSASQEADLARQIGDRLSGIASLMGGAHGGPMPGTPGGFDPPNMQMILTMMEKMMEKLPKVFAIFAEEGIPISQEAREAYENGAALFRELKPQCEADAQKCFALKNVAVLFEKMRPSMEKAIMESGKFEVGMRIHQVISEGMEGMPMQGHGPSGGQFGPPSNGTYGPPPPGDYGPPSNSDDASGSSPL